jgi:hypothetical protein
MFTARAMTSAMAVTATADWSIIMSLAQRVSAATSPAGKEMAFVNDKYRYSVKAGLQSAAGDGCSAMSVVSRYDAERFTKARNVSPKQQEVA